MYKPQRGICICLFHSRTGPSTKSIDNTRPDTHKHTHTQYAHFPERSITSSADHRDNNNITLYCVWGERRASHLSLARRAWTVHRILCTTYVYVRRCAFSAWFTRSHRSDGRRMYTHDLRSQISAPAFIAYMAWYDVRRVGARSSSR